MIYTEHFIYNLINGKEFSLEKLMFIHMICSINISIEQNKIDEFNLKPPDIFKQVVNDTISSLFEKIENKNYKNFHNGENFLFLRGYKNIYEISQLPVLNQT